MLSVYPTQCDHDATRRARHLGRAFLWQLALRLDLSAAFHAHPGRPATCWLDRAGRFNQAQVRALSQHLPGPAEAPLVVRVSVNALGFHYERAVRRRCGWDHVAPGEESGPVWRYELTLLAEQLPAFVPWVAMLVQAKVGQEASPLAPPPQACRFWSSPHTRCDYVWTVQAWEALGKARLTLVHRQPQRGHRGSVSRPGTAASS